MLYIFVPALVLCYWRGTWELCDIYFFPDSLNKSTLLSLIVGYGGMACYFMMQYFLYHIRHHNPKRENIYENIVFSALSRVETYFVGFFVVNCWRGLWFFQDIYLIPSNPTMSAWASHCIGIVFLVALSKLKSVYAPPAVEINDTDHGATRMNLLSYYSQFATENRDSEKGVVGSAIDCLSRTSGSPSAGPRSDVELSDVV